MHQCIPTFNWHPGWDDDDDDDEDEDEDEDEENPVTNKEVRNNDEE